MEHRRTRRHPSWARATASPTRCSCPRASPRAGVVILHGAGSARSRTSTSRAAAAPTASPRWPTTRAATGARGRRSGRAPSTTRWRWWSCCAAHARAGRAARLEHGRLHGDPRRRARPLAVRGRGHLPGAGGPAAARPARRRPSALPLRRGRDRGVARVARPLRAVAALGPDTALLLLHARGDEQVPYTIERGAVRRGPRAQAAAGPPGRAPPLAAARHGAPGRVAPLRARCGRPAAGPN